MSNEPNLNPVVTIQEGKVKGFLCDDYRGSPFYNFLGIPYAQPPINELRFKAPVPIKPWSGILDCTQGSNISIQEDYISKEIDGSEDCLNLNVFTRQLPAIHTSKKLLKPVMVYIHGGAFLLGSNRKEIYGPEILISEDVVVVTINYRLGLLGFLKFDDPNLNVPGNTALKDMVLALKWVQRNIEHFLGNPKNVTIFGNSAGAAAVHFLVLSPMAKGLFHKAICQSGSALSSWAYADKNTNEQLAKIIGLSKPSEERLYEHLKSLPVEEIYRMQCQLDKIYIKGNRYRFVGAVVEPTKWNGEKFFSDHPLKLLKSGKYNKVPLMMGYNTGDGMILDGMVQPSQNHIYWTDKELNVPGLLNLEKGSSLSKQLGNEIVQFYFGTDEISREKHLKELYDVKCNIIHKLFILILDVSSVNH
ncbi:hypothetical protein ABEB36_007242 [Hypothenemus hampei]|uniref:Carboxylesterase type B domain-containing protein n=1 Tax=Hypothenemus hampei TaxID=57062 RepID=A0ABD1EWE4_HYPHA